MKYKIKIILNKSVTFIKRTSRVIFRFISQNIKRKEVIIALAAIPAIILWSMVWYRYAITPRAPQIREAGSDSNYLYVAGSNIFGAKFGDSKTNAPKVEFTLPKTDKSVTFYPANTNKSLTKPVRENNGIKFIDVYENVDFSYRTLPLGVKEDIIIKKPGSASTFPFYLDAKNVTPKYFTEKLAGGVFYDENKNYIFHFEKPFAVDAAGKRTEKVDISIKREEETQKLMAILTVDRAWLNDPSREYPVYVDPTVIHDTSSEFATGSLNHVKDTGSGSSPVLETYYHELPSDQNTAALWHLNEASGNVLDSSGNGNTGTPGGTTVVAGLLSNARSLNGSTDYIYVPTSSSLDLTSYFTIESWVNLTSAAGTQRIVNKWNGGGGYLLAPSESGNATPRCLASDGTYGYRDADKTIPINKWTHVACVYNGPARTIDIYINGQLSNGALAGTVPLKMTASASDLYLGAASSGASGVLNGKMDEVRISNVAHSPEEIAQNANRSPYSVYTSDVIDLSQTIAAWNSLSWTELGVATGDGESLKDTTGLVAQWNFNELTGNVANASSGSCGSSCNGTLTNFGPTDSPDGTVMSGWTANNKRWGTGALMFDGTNDWVNAGTFQGPQSAFTYETWIYPTANGTHIIASQYGANSYFQFFHIDSTVYARIHQVTDSIFIGRGAQSALELNKWQHFAFTWSGGTTSASIKIYKNGVQVDTVDNAAGSFTAPYSGTVQFDIGAQGTGGGAPFSGIIDTSRAYSRALGASEILSNYNATNIELQTRVGSDSSPDDGGWEDWTPTTNEVSLESFDDNPDPDYYANLLMHGDGANNSTAFVDSSNVPHSLTANGDAQIDSAESKFGGSSMLFDGTGDKVTTPDSDDFYFDGDFTIDLWVKFNALPAAGGGNTAMNLVTQTSAVSRGWGLVFWRYGVDQLTRLSWQQQDATLTSATGQFWNPSINTWYHIAVTRSGTSLRLFVDGTQLGGTTTDADFPGNTAAQVVVGSTDYAIIATTGNFNGWMDELRITKGIARWTSNFAAASSAYDNPTTLITSTDTAIKIEGLGAEKIQTGQKPVDGNTMGLWHFEETGGSGAFIKDSSLYANNGTPTNTTVVNGISGKGRNFDGSGDYIEALQATSPTAYTLEAWVKPTSITSRGIVVRTNSSGPGTSWSHQLRINSSGNFEHYTFDGGLKTVTGTTVVTAGKWYHVVGTATNGGNMYLFVNGVQEGTPAAVATLWTGGDRWHFGSSSGGSISTFDGTIDEIRISNIARSSDEVAESYRMGRDHYINKSITSTDLSGKNTIPFYVAADKPGTYLAATAGESAYANYQPDTNTVGLWHLDEATGSAAFAMDSSGNGNHGTPTVTSTFTQGKIGGARNFNGTTDNITPISAPAVSANGNWTYDLWVKFNVAPTGGYFLDRTTATNNVISFIADGSAFYFQKRYDDNTGLTTTSSGKAPVINRWYHVAVTRNYNSNFLFYINGQLVSTISDTGSKTLTAPIFKLGTHQNSSSGTNGVIDEFRISDIARSAEDIRSAYEIGKRTHEVTIDFGAKLSADDLITGSGDYGFEVDATYYGLSQQADQLFKGDKIIVRENYDGTEYIAQGTVSAVTASSGAVTVASWDAGSTFPSGGYTVNASVFKWQREYWNITEPIDSQLNATTNLSLRLTDGAEGRTIWIDDFKSAGDYLTTSTGSTISSSTGYRYLQYRVIGHTNDNAVSANLTSLTLDYVDSSPTSPTELYTESSVNPVDVTDTTPEFSAICNDPNTGDILNKYRILVDNDQSFASPVWDSGASGTSMTNCTQGIRSSDISFGGTPLALDGGNYFWKIKFWDDGGTEGAWSEEFATFRMSAPPNAALNFGTPSSCRIQETSDDTSLTLLWSDNSTGETQFRIEKSTDAGAFGFLANPAANATSNLDSSVAQGHTYQYRVRAEGTVNTEWCTSNTVSLQAGTFEVKGLDLKGLELR